MPKFHLLSNFNMFNAGEFKMSIIHRKDGREWIQHINQNRKFSMMDTKYCLKDAKFFFTKILSSD